MGRTQVTIPIGGVVFSRATGEEGINEVRSMFGVRANILIAHSIQPNCKVSSTHNLSYLKLFHLRNGCYASLPEPTEFNCLSVVGLTKYTHITISVVSTG